MSGDVSLAADIPYLDPNGYGDRKAVLVIRQNLDDDSKKAIVALHGQGMIHLAVRPMKDVRIKGMGIGSEASAVRAEQLLTTWPALQPGGLAAKEEETRSPWLSAWKANG